MEFTASEETEGKGSISQFQQQQKIRLFWELFVIKIKTLQNQSLDQSLN